jgi:hypothetical protein
VRVEWARCCGGSDRGSAIPQGANPSFPFQFLPPSCGEAWAERLRPRRRVRVGGSPAMEAPLLVHGERGMAISFLLSPSVLCRAMERHGLSGAWRLAPRRRVRGGWLAGHGGPPCLCPWRETAGDPCASPRVRFGILPLSVLPVADVFRRDSSPGTFLQLLEGFFALFFFLPGQPSFLICSLSSPVCSSTGLISPAVLAAMASVLPGAG